LPRPVDWTPLFQLAGLDQAALQPATPQWNWLAASDTRAAWTGVWPGSGRPLRVEAAALGGRPVDFQVSGPWQVAWRMADPASQSTSPYLVILLILTLLILGGSLFLAVQNFRDGRGDRRGALRLGASMTLIMLALWICTVHIVADVLMVVIFLVALATAIFYGVQMWMLYLALEPLVRRAWPQVVVSWTHGFSGRCAAAY